MNWTLLILCVLFAALFVLVTERVIRWMADRAGDHMADKMLAKALAGDGKAEYLSPIQISFTEDTITLVDTTDDRKLSFSWNDVEKVSAHKKDLLTYDMVCVIFETGPDLEIEVDETMKGFTELMGAAGENLPGMTSFSDWYFKITQPAFAENSTPLFDRSSSK